MMDTIIRCESTWTLPGSIGAITMWKALKMAPKMESR
jgi:hypothetical protein